MEATNDDGEVLVGLAEQAAEAIQGLNHRTRRTIPAPWAYEVLGRLTQIAHGLPQLFDQLGDGLHRSLDEYDVYDHARAPAVSVELVCAALDDATTHAARLGELLEEAHAAIADQGRALPVQEPPTVTVAEAMSGSVERPATDDGLADSRWFGHLSTSNAEVRQRPLDGP